jgi:hypothetical protein
MISTVSEFMNADHAYLDKLWSNFMSAGDGAKEGVKLFFKFNQHIKLHIKLENDFLFPKFNDYLGFTAGMGPTVKLYRDHDSILKLLGEVEKFFQSGQTSKIIDVKNHIQQKLIKHRKRENETEYPVCDNFINPKELEKMVTAVFGTNKVHLFY